MAISHVESLKLKGNKAFQERSYETAIILYTQAIGLDPTNETLYSNRSAAYNAMGKYHEALSDAQVVINMKEDWARGHARLGAAYFGLKDYESAANAYKRCLELDPENKSYKEELDKCERMTAMTSSDDGQMLNDIGKLFKPEKLEILKNNPQTSIFFKDQAFNDMIQDLFLNPSHIKKYLKSPPLQMCIKALVDPVVQDHVCKTKNDFSAAVSLPEAEKQKEEGNNLFRSGKFEQSITFYQKAIDLDPKNVIYYNNKATALTKLKKYEEAISVLREGIKIGETQKIQAEHVGKAYAKLGQVYKVQNQVDLALDAFTSSLKYNQDENVKNEIHALKA